jgi:hypothetical protein
VLRRFAGLRQGLARGHHLGNRERDEAFGEPGMGRGVVGIFLQRFAKIPDGFFDIFLGSLFPVIESAQIARTPFRGGRRRFRGCFLLLGFLAQRFGDCMRYIVLDG